MSELLHLALGEEFLDGGVEGIKFGAERYPHIEVKHIVEAIGGVAVQLLLLLIPCLVHTLEIHAVGHVDARRNAQILKEHERSRDRDRVLETCLPIAEEIGMDKLTLLHIVDSDTPVSGVTEADFLIPFLFADGFLPLEGIDAAHVHAQFRQRQRERTVLRALRDVRREREAPRAVGETLRVRDIRTLGVLRVQLGVVVGIDIAAVVARGGEVHARRESGVWVGFRILRVCPLNAEVACLRIVGHVFLPRYIVAKVDTQVAAELIPPNIFRLRPYRPCAAGVDIACNLQIHIVIDGKVITQPAQV